MNHLAFASLAFCPSSGLRFATIPTCRAITPVMSCLAWLAIANMTWEVETVCAVRGEFQLGPMTVVSGDPFGLFHSPRRVGATDRLIVYPMTVELNRVILPVGFLSGGDAQRQLTHQITTNASSIRDYVSGDSMNRIHWRSTARTGNIMVKGIRTGSAGGHLALQ